MGSIMTRVMRSTKSIAASWATSSTVQTPASMPTPASSSARITSAAPFSETLTDA
jgi:hypothetical protein